MDLEKAELFKKDCESKLSFAVSRYGFSHGTLECVPEKYRITVFFARRRVGLECRFEYFERDVQIDVLRLVDGAKPEGYWYQDGMRVRASLFIILEHRGNLVGVPRKVSRKQAKKIEALDDREFWLRMLEIEAERLRNHGEDILNDDPSCLDGLPPMG